MMGMRLEKEWIGKRVKVFIDRPFGSIHPEWPNLIYQINYGYIPETLAADGEPIDAYVVGPDQALDSFEGEVIAIIRRDDDIEDKLVVAHQKFQADDIKQAVNFQEKYFKSHVETH